MREPELTKTEHIAIATPACGSGSNSERTKESERHGIGIGKQISSPPAAADLSSLAPPSARGAGDYLKPADKTENPQEGVGREMKRNSYSCGVVVFIFKRQI